ncbi:hypothetical protein [Methylobacterium sp. GC_Met_2]|uniref:hypothetical protein n=1 Tax=Methylobacterium sp. GC_Met_2 TaxID=2937376 RepID=UPI00226B2A40|nr:hypothetical protein [Methylobacterium sp. GC_Met_2]
MTRVPILDAGSFWITGYLEETKLARIAIGGRAAVQLMGFAPRIIGHVESIGRGIADPNDSPDHLGLPSVNPVFTWVRLAQRIPVRLHIDTVPPGVMLAAGMTYSVGIGDEEPKGRLWSMLNVLR